MKDPRDEVDRRVLLGDKTGSVVVMQRSIMFQSVWVWISTTHACIRIQLTIRTLSSQLRKFLFALGIPKLKYCEIRAVTVRVFCESEHFDRSETSHWSCVRKINTYCVIGFLKSKVKLF
jgi:hypothetical protein